MTKIYRGNGSNYGDVICNVKDGKVYKGNGSNYGDVICNVKDGKVYKGNGSNYGDVICNVKDGKVYKGNGSNYGDVICNVKDGKVYKGNGSNYSDVICNVKDGKVHKGNGSNYGDVIISADKVLSTSELIAVLYAAKIVDIPSLRRDSSSNSTKSKQIQASDKKKAQSSQNISPKEGCAIFFLTIIICIGYGVFNFFAGIGDRHRAEIESKIQPFLQERDYSGAEEFLLDNKKYLNTTCVDLLFDEALAHKKGDILVDMLERTSNNGNYSSSKIYKRVLQSYARVGDYTKIIEYFDEFGYKKSLINRVVETALNTEQYKVVTNVLESVKNYNMKYLPKNFGDIVSALLEKKRFSDCQKLIVGTDAEYLYTRDIVRAMAENGNRAGAKNYIKSKRQFFVDNDMMFNYEALMREADTW